MLFGLLMAFASSQVAYSNIIIDDPLTNDPGDNNGGIRSITTTINTSVEENLVTFDVNRYVGVVSVSVNSANMPSPVTECFYINGHTCFTMDFTEYESGVYTISITLANGQVFIGQLIKE